ncbi:DUF6092 family protein [Candidatus Cryosericum septentrionale]|jgi:hypothetical protein|uniref:Uncharacterized protein n=1 Tax=Candidatus Cryosericum septentrionale TaxID=2290913 RepID=A0A398DZW6_9BACT|nr:DUF6092 family protein [Candidatus Cryosericum septentrionale]RIE16874.1 hypothetical protein SMC1_04250 [Candidatus Cryosericum septentrionale]
MQMNETFKEQIFGLVGYMLTSACNLVNETKSYGPFRLIDAASRLITILSENNISSPSLEKIREKIEQGKYKVMEDDSQFSAFLNDLVLYTVSLIENQN